MLKTINTIYFICFVLLNLILLPKISGEYLLINYLALFSFMSYYSMLQLNSSISRINYENKYFLWLEVFFYSLFFVIFYNTLSYYYSNNFFTFYLADPWGYHIDTIKLVNNPSFTQGVKEYLQEWEVADLGIILLTYPFYLIVQSNLILNFFYIFVGAFTALAIFNISKNFMSSKYAFVGALAYSLSSFTLYFQSTGLKESFMIMITLLTFDFYYRFLKGNKIIHLVLFLIFGSILILFRPAILAIILTSIGVSLFLSNKRGILVKILPYLIVVITIIMWKPISTMALNYMDGGYEALIYAKEVEGMIKGGLPFTYMINTLIQLIGPIPSPISEKPMQLFDAPGLIYRMLLAFPFWMGVVYVFKTKKYVLYPLTFFVLLEMSALIFLLEGLELRKAIPQIPIIYIIAFWFLDQYDRKIINFRKRKRFQRFFYTSMSLLFLLMVAWNLR